MPTEAQTIPIARIDTEIREAFKLFDKYPELREAAHARQEIENELGMICRKVSRGYDTTDVSPDIPYQAIAYPCSGNDLSYAISMAIDPKQSTNQTVIIESADENDILGAGSDSPEDDRAITLHDRLFLGVHSSKSDMGLHGYMEQVAMISMNIESPLTEISITPGLQGVTHVAMAFGNGFTIHHNIHTTRLPTPGEDTTVGCIEYYNAVEAIAMAVEPENCLVLHKAAFDINTFSIIRSLSDHLPINTMVFSDSGLWNEDTSYNFLCDQEHRLIPLFDRLQNICRPSSLKGGEPGIGYATKPEQLSLLAVRHYE